MKIETLEVGFLRTNCYIAYNESTRHAFIVDPGSSSQRILDKVKELGLDVDHIFLTHSHFDHVMALADVQKTTGAAVAVHGSEAGFIEKHDTRVLSLLGLPQIMIKPAHADVILHDGDEIECIGEKFKVLNTPGHTEGSICLDNGSVLFTGDTLFQNGCGRCDLPGGSVKDMYASLSRLAAIDGDRLVYPGHGPSTTLANERANNINMINAEVKE